MAELDDIGSETAAMMRTMLQMATLVALKSREHGQKEAEARAKAVEAKMKEARELQVREARDLKAKDPRNIELVQMMSVGNKATQARGLSLEKDPSSPFASTATSTAASVGANVPQVGYDSVERRAAIAAHLQRAGVAPELAEVRMLVEMGQGISPEEAIRRTNAGARRAGMERAIDPRGLERGR
ncbi:hypothetical protein NN3_54830 [Nocardia neocaledoniensis NBRC 108232]|uniref:Uncharacterized protein n=1 Tax=Nocardia neocaledoniensis TaxID=236511 RepID=A0A317P0S6_9NOCA|nr:hypothetical protein [Nocardia neocaledoniensis]PWV80987.1 hypothetical protein DFR69_101323 [Nocardia neocaledoniensis]GEM34476.1 hypothetical protein NN3_54830 [Nocardia neocaledoniensis NBRC 108232]